MTNEEISKYIFIEDDDLSGDIAFVFGTWDVYKDSCKRAVELYKNKFVRKILVTGGVNPKSGEVEGDLMAEEIINLGVPPKDILIENKASNTLENVIFSLDVLDKEIRLQNIKTIVAVVKNIHARRALMTLQKHVPKHIGLKSAPYQSVFYDNVDKYNWFESEVRRQFVFNEIEKIKKYLTKGDIAEL